MTKKKTKDRLEEELLADPKTAAIVRDARDSRRQEKLEKAQADHFTDLSKVIKGLSGTLSERIAISDMLQKEGSEQVVKELKEVLATIVSVGDDSQKLTEKHLLDMIKVLEEVNKKELSVTVEAPIVEVPEPKVLDQTKIIQETKHAEAANQILMKILQHAMKQDGAGVLIKNKEPGDAIPVVLTDKTKNVFYNTIDRVVTASGNGIRLLFDIFRPYSINIQDDTSNSDLQYIGMATTGSDTSDLVWQIQRIDCATGTIVLWADGNGKFDNVFDDRETLTYL